MRYVFIVLCLMASFNLASSQPAAKIPNKEDETKITTDATKKDKISIPNNFRLVTDGIVLSLRDSVPVFDIPVDSTQILTRLRIGAIYDVMASSENWLAIFIDGNTGYVNRNFTFFTSNRYSVYVRDESKRHYYKRVNKSKYRLWYEVFSSTRDLTGKYEEMLLAAPDTVRIEVPPEIEAQRLTFVPVRLAIDLVKARIYQRNRQWDQYIDLWDKIASIYPDVIIYSSDPASLTALFEQANAFLSLGDSTRTYTKYAEIIEKFPNFPLAGYEWSRDADVWAFQKFLDSAEAMDMSVEQRLQYYDRFIEISTSNLLKAIVNLQRSDILIRNGEFKEVENTWCSIISDSPLVWSSFKNRGDIRGAAMLQWRDIGFEVIGINYAINSMLRVPELTQDDTMIWLSKYLLIELYELVSDTRSIEETLQYLENHPFEGMSLSLLPGNYVGPWVPDPKLLQKGRTRTTTPEWER